MLELFAASAAFDPAAATQAFLDSVPAEQRALGDAYFEGGYWLELWGALFTIGACWVLLHFRWSLWMRDIAKRIGRWGWLVPVVYAIPYLVASSALLLPWRVYADFFREHQYGFATQTFAEWFGEQLLGLLVGTIQLAILLGVVYAVIRRTPRTWWVWGSGVTVGLMIVAMVLSPVLIAPLFNEYTPLPDGTLKERILTMAAANGVPAEEVYVVDASKQTKRISAFVSGYGNTARIALNDNLLERGTEAEILAVMGHETGHFALGLHPLIMGFALVIVAGFGFCRWAFPRFCGAVGARWGVHGVEDVAGFPVLVGLLAAFALVTTPVTNSIVRANEAAADIFGLNAAREPDGFATIALKLGEYRKLEPSALEEFVMFDHPSGKTRIRMSMEWKAAQERADRGEPEAEKKNR